MVSKGLPKSYLIQPCRTELNEVCHIDCLPGRHHRAKVHSVEGLIKDYVEEYLRENPDTEKMQIKINGDGAYMTYGGFKGTYTFLSLFFHLRLSCDFLATCYLLVTCYFLATCYLRLSCDFAVTFL